MTASPSASTAGECVQGRLCPVPPWLPHRDGCCSLWAVLSVAWDARLPAFLNTFVGEYSLPNSDVCEQPFCDSCCSAGCGRTGVVCAIDYTWKLLKDGVGVIPPRVLTTRVLPVVVAALSSLCSLVQTAALRCSCAGRLETFLLPLLLAWTSACRAWLGTGLQSSIQVYYYLSLHTSVSDLLSFSSLNNFSFLQDCSSELQYIQSDPGDAHTKAFNSADQGMPRKFCPLVYTQNRNLSSTQEDSQQGSTERLWGWEGVCSCSVRSIF